MQDKLETLICEVYKKWKEGLISPSDSHLDEEALVCLLEARLDKKESEPLIGHLLSCQECLEKFVVSLKSETSAEDVPEELLERIKSGVYLQEKQDWLEIALKFKEKMLEIINTTGDVLVGQELVPSAVLRSRSIKEFKDEINIRKDFKDITVEVKVENKGANAFNLNILVRQKGTQKISKGLRATLLKDDLELESYITESGTVSFEQIPLGKYAVEISSVEEKLAALLVDIKA